MLGTTYRTSITTQKTKIDILTSMRTSNLRESIKLADQGSIPSRNWDSFHSPKTSKYYFIASIVLYSSINERYPCTMNFIFFLHSQNIKPRR
jgi:hypothetical protein